MLHSQVQRFARWSYASCLMYAPGQYLASVHVVWAWSRNLITTPRLPLSSKVGLHRQRRHEPVVVALANVFVEPPCLGKLLGVLKHLQRIRLEDQLLAPAEGAIIVVAFERGRDVALPKVQI